MISLLQEFPHHEYPDDYLLARLQSRRGRLPADDSAGGTTDTEIWNREKSERQWLFRQMHIPFRRAMAPLFFYFEIRTLIQSLRYIDAGIAYTIEQLVARSLLAAGLKKILLTKASIENVLERLEIFFHDSPLPLKGLPAVFHVRGIQGCEEAIRTIFFAQVLRQGGDSYMHSFYQYFIALENTLTLAKCRRWNKKSTPPVVRGDGIEPRVLPLAVTDDLLRRMIRRLTKGKEISAEQLHPAALEPVLYAALLLKLVRDRREGVQEAACIEYLWRNYFAAKERSLFLHQRPQWKGSMTAGEMVQ